MTSQAVFIVILFLSVFAGFLHASILSTSEGNGTIPANPTTEASLRTKRNCVGRNCGCRGGQCNTAMRTGFGGCTGSGCSSTTCHGKTCSTSVQTYCSFPCGFGGKPCCGGQKKCCICCTTVCQIYCVQAGICICPVGHFGK
ncbi:hypothetical protein RB195_021156 [Necator americanus]|uniref:Uncharacterized protein n=1 Tax=Necator americanus TaxID=51031 RepID=A0ABR1E9U1_NECAM